MPALAGAIAAAGVRVVTDVSAADWDATSRATPTRRPTISGAGGEIFERVFGHRSGLLAARRGDAIVGVLPLVQFRSLLFGRSIVSMPFLNYGGLLTDDAEAAGALVDHTNQHGARVRCVACRAAPRSTAARGPAVPAAQARVRRELPATSDDLWTDTDRKVRNQVRKAQKEGLVVRGGRTGAGRRLLRGLRPEHARPGHAGLSKAPVRRNARAPVAERERVRRPTRTSDRWPRRWRSGSADSSIVPWASSLREFRHLCPNMLLYWAMLERAIAMGLTAFDFGRSSPRGGTHQFKLQWGASESPLFWEYPHLAGGELPDHGPTNPRFQAAVAVWKRCPLWFTNTVGPHVVRSIP